MVDATCASGCRARCSRRFNPHPPLMVDATLAVGPSSTALCVFQSPSTVDGGCNDRLSASSTLRLTAFQSPSTVDGGCNYQVSTATLCDDEFQSPSTVDGGCNVAHDASTCGRDEFQSPSTVDGGCNVVLEPPSDAATQVSIPIHR